MAAYMIVNIEVKDPRVYEEYKAAVPVLVCKHGGEYLVRGGECRVLEGNWRPSRLVVFRFPDMKSIEAFLDDPEYRPLKALRHRVARTETVVAEGV